MLNHMEGGKTHRPTRLSNEVNHKIKIFYRQKRVGNLQYKTEFDIQNVSCIWSQPFTNNRI
jgi:hypothetical protein